MKTYTLNCEDYKGCKKCPADIYSIKINGGDNGFPWEALKKLGLWEDYRKSDIPCCTYLYSYMMNKKALLEEILK